MLSLFAMIFRDYRRDKQSWFAFAIGPYFIGQTAIYKVNLQHKLLVVILI